MHFKCLSFSRSSPYSLVKNARESLMSIYTHNINNQDQEMTKLAQFLWMNEFRVYNVASQ